MDIKTEVTALTANILTWLQEHGPDYVRGPYNPGATEAELTTLEASLGRPLPPALTAMLRVANGDFYIGEYAVLSAEHIASTWAGCKHFFDDGTFARFEAYDDDRDLLSPGWWHPGLIPVLEDSCGNQLCIDLDPGPRGVAGQMVWWETRAGPFPHGADSLLALLCAHWKHLSSGKYDAPEDWDMASCMELTQAEQT
jgi:cell wall assembly regulator SMI1